MSWERKSVLGNGFEKGKRNYIAFSTTLFISPFTSFLFYSWFDFPNMIFKASMWNLGSWFFSHYTFHLKIVLRNFILTQKTILLLPNKCISSIHVLYFLQHAAYFWYLYDVMRAFEKIRELVILDWYFSGRIEITSTWKKCNKRKECRYVILFYLLTFLHLITNCWSVNIIYCSIAA